MAAQRLTPAPAPHATSATAGVHVSTRSLDTPAWVRAYTMEYRGDCSWLAPRQCRAVVPFLISVPLRSSGGTGNASSQRSPARKPNFEGQVQNNRTQSGPELEGRGPLRKVRYGPLSRRARYRVAARWRRESESGVRIGMRRHQAPLRGRKQSRFSAAAARRRVLGWRQSPSNPYRHSTLMARRVSRRFPAGRKLSGPSPEMGKPYWTRPFSLHLSGLNRTLHLRTAGQEPEGRRTRTCWAQYAEGCKNPGPMSL